MYYFALSNEYFHKPRYIDLSDVWLHVLDFINRDTCTSEQSGK